MKRDLDLARQLLLDIESRGTDCSVSVLRSASEFERNESNDERVRYHLRLLIDGGYLKEIDRTSSGIPCVRLTHEGHEFLELARPEVTWRDAKHLCHERIGGLSLRVIQNILVYWAVAETERLPRLRRSYPGRRPRYEPEYSRERLAYRVEPYRTLERWEEPEFETTDGSRYVRVRPTTTEYRDRPSRYGVDVDGDGRIDFEYEPTHPTYLI